MDSSQIINLPFTQKRRPSAIPVYNSHIPLTKKHRTSALRTTLTLGHQQEMGVTKYQPTLPASSSGGKPGSSTQKKVPLSADFIKIVQQNFMSGKPFIVCPTCKDIGTINLSADTNPKYDPPGPIFHCKECRKQYAHMGILEAITIADAEASAIGAKPKAKITQLLGKNQKTKKTLTINQSSNMETEHEDKQQLEINNNIHNSNNNNITTNLTNTNNQSWADQMDQLSFNPEDYDTNHYDHLHPRTPEFVRDLHKRMDETNKMVAKLAEAVAENTKLVRDSMKLAMELQAAKNEINQLRQNQHQQTQSDLATNLEQTGNTTGSSASKYAPMTSTPTKPKTAPDNSYASAVAKVKTTTKTPPKKRAIVAAARHLSEVPTNQGYQFLYIPTKHRMTISNLRNILRTLRIENSRVLDIHFPDHKTAALLVHNDFASVIVNRLIKFGVNIKDNFNPLDPTLLKDPKLAELSQTDRETKIKEVHHGHIMKALTFIREPVKFSVARCFYLENQITQEEYDQIRSTTRTRQHYPSNSAAEAIAALQQSGKPQETHDSTAMDCSSDNHDVTDKTSSRPNSPPPSNNI